jgi:hypothetical protein
MLLLFLRIFMGIVLGVVVSTVFKVIIGFDQFLYIFFILLTTLVLVRLTRGWSFVKLLVLGLVLVLIGILIRFYVMMAAS